MVMVQPAADVFDDAGLNAMGGFVEQQLSHELKLLLPQQLTLVGSTATRD